MPSKLARHFPILQADSPAGPRPSLPDGTSGKFSAWRAPLRRRVTKAVRNALSDKSYIDDVWLARITVIPDTGSPGYDDAEKA